MESQNRVSGRITNTTVLIVFAAIALSSVFVSLSLLGKQEPASAWWSTAFQNLASELIGAFLTFMLIDILISGREKREAEAREEARRLKQRLIKRMRSPNQDITAEAASELRRLGWLEDGSLEGAYLSYANLRNVDLSGGDLDGARLTKAKLHGANLSGADLVGTTLKISQLAQVGSLRGASMPDGKRYDGRLNLEGDLIEAARLGLDQTHAEEMGGFYGIEPNDYATGQEWASENIPTIREETTREPYSPWWKP